MNEYAVKKALAKRSGQSNNAASAAAQSVNGIPNSVLTDVLAGKRRGTIEMMRHREELAPSIAAKMSQAFGMDFSAVKVYRSDAMAGTEMHGMAQGDKVVLSSDVDLNTREGQATLGHEFSHIRAQSMGLGSGRGLLNDAALEHQADSEGILAARGMRISGESMGMSMGLGMAGVEGLSPIGAGLGASAGAPMQAAKGVDNDDRMFALLSKKKNDGLTPQETAELSKMQKKASPEAIIRTANFQANEDDPTFYQWKAQNRKENPEGVYSTGTILAEALKTQHDTKKHDSIVKKLDKYKSSKFLNCEKVRIMYELCTSSQAKLSEDEIEQIFADGYSDDEEKRKKAYFRLKDIHYQSLLKKEAQFGKLPSQMQTMDLLHRFGKKGTIFGLQDLMSLQDLSREGNHNIPFADPKKEAHYQHLNEYYEDMTQLFYSAGMMDDEDTPMFLGAYHNIMDRIKEHEKYIKNGPQLSKKQQKAYNKNTAKRINSGELMAMPERPEEE